MFETGKYSDLTIACREKSYPVHRVLLASRSSFFEGVCRNPFRESESGIIDLSEDDAEAVEHMVHCTLFRYNMLRCTGPDRALTNGCMQTSTTWTT